MIQLFCCQQQDSAVLILVPNSLNCLPSAPALAGFEATPPGIPTILLYVPVPEASATAVVGYFDAASSGGYCLCVIRCN